MQAFLSLLWLLAVPALADQAELDRILFDPVHRNQRTDAALILSGDRVVYENYGAGYGPDRKHLSWSVAKMSAGILMGIAEERGLLRLTDPVSRWIPEYRDSGTILDFLRMSSNLAFVEEYSGVPVTADVVRMLYLEGPRQGMADYVSRLPLRRGSRPGDHFYYSSGDTNVLMEVLKRAAGARYDSFPWDEYFNRLGLPDATLEQDSRGTFVGSSYLYLTARGFGRIGQMVASGGVWNGDRVIPPSYWQLMNTVAPGASKTAYSVQLKTNRPIPGRGLPAEYPELPDDALLIFGHQGQILIMIPSTRTVIVRLATDRGWPLDEAAFYTAVRNHLREQGLPAWPMRPLVKKPRAAASEDLSSGDGDGDGDGDDREKKTPWTAYLKVPRLIRALGAKEYCSCVFVLGRSPDTCREDLKAELPVQALYRVDRARRTVRATFGVEGASTAQYVSERVGCHLQR